MVRKNNLLIIIFFFLFQNVFSQVDKDSIIYNEEYAPIFIYESMPEFKGDLIVFIQKQVHYPETAIADSIEGRVFVSFWVDTMGSTVNHKVVSGIRKDLNQEALRVTKLIRFEKPAVQNGKPTEVEYTVSVEFKLPKKSEIKEKTK